MAREGASWQDTPGPRHPAPSGTGCSCLHGTFQRAGRGLQTGQVRWQAPGLAARPPGEKAQARLTNGSHKRVRSLLLWLFLTGRGGLG